ncbi:hypothetical protein CHUAL_003198 [Chamberlinius hualienensis]
MSSPLIVRLVAASVSVANKAGEIVRDIMKKGDLGIVQKGWNDLQTQADRSAQQCIVASLIKQFPGVKVIGEEESINLDDVPKDWLVEQQDGEVLGVKCPSNLSSVQDSEVVVWVDPLDGTAEYTQGLLDHVTVLIGIAVGDKAVAGVIHQPYYNYKAPPGSPLGRTIWGIVGSGAHGYTTEPLPKDKRIITTTRSHCTPEVQAALDAMAPDDVIRVGGAGHKVLLLLEGKAHAYVFASKGCKKWDTCAPEAVLHSAEGKLTDVHGNYYKYNADIQKANSGGVLATAIDSDHEWYQKRIPEELLRILPVVDKK